MRPKTPARGPRHARAASKTRRVVTSSRIARKRIVRVTRKARHAADKVLPTAVPAAVSIFAATRLAAARAASANEQSQPLVHVEPQGDSDHTAAGATPLKSPGRSARLGPWSLAGSAACVLIVLFLVGAPKPAQVDSHSDEPAAAPIETPAPVRNASEEAPPVKDAAVRLEIKKREPATLSAAKVEVPAPMPMPMILPAAVPPPLPKLVAAAEPAPAAHAASAPAPTPIVDDPSVFTVTGCLDVNKDGFRLNNTSGENVPQSRSWKSGFLRKRSATILLEDSGRVGLGAHVGELVTVTGTLEDRDMEVRSLHRIASSCEK